MLVQNIECQIAQAQIGRFVSGGSLSPEALEQLEAHIGECAACEAFLSERRAALQAILHGASKPQSEPRLQPGAAAVEMPAGAEAPKRPAFNVPARLRSLLAAPTRTDPEREPDLDRRAKLKPLLLSGALAVVLVAMSLLSNGPTALFGEKVLPAATPARDSAATKDPKPPATTDSPPPSVDPAPPAASNPPPKAAPVSNPSPTTPAPTVESAVAKPSTLSAPPRPAATKPARNPAPKPPRPTGSIRVYDANGNPISPGR